MLKFFFAQDGFSAGLKSPIWTMTSRSRLTLNFFFILFWVVALHGELMIKWSGVRFLKPVFNVVWETAFTKREWRHIWLLGKKNWPRGKKINTWEGKGSLSKWQAHGKAVALNDSLHRLVLGTISKLNESRCSWPRGQVAPVFNIYYFKFII